MAEEITLAKACMNYFTPKMTTTEYRELSHEDKVSLREEFIKEGFNITPLQPPKPDET
jgi:hypothetical protein